MPRLIDERESKRQSPNVQLGNKIRDDPARRFFECRRFGKQRRSVSIVAQAEQDKIVPIYLFAALSC